jgi:hypothetical protein
MKQTLQSQSRRAFLGSVGAAALAPAIPVAVHAKEALSGAQAGPDILLTGNGEWTDKVVPGWATLPPGTTFSMVSSPACAAAEPAQGRLGISPIRVTKVPQRLSSPRRPMLGIRLRRSERRHWGTDANFT